MGSKPRGLVPRMSEGNDSRCRWSLRPRAALRLRRGRGQVLRRLGQQRQRELWLGLGVRLAVAPRALEFLDLLISCLLILEFAAKKGLFTKHREQPLFFFKKLA